MHFHARVRDPSAAVRRRHLPKQSLGRKRDWSRALPASYFILHLAAWTSWKSLNTLPTVLLVMRPPASR